MKYKITKPSGENVLIEADYVFVDSNGDLSFTVTEETEVASAPCYRKSVAVAVFAKGHWSSYYDVTHITKSA